MTQRERCGGWALLFVLKKLLRCDVKLCSCIFITRNGGGGGDGELS